MSLNINLNYGQTVPNINVTGTFTTGSAIIPNEIVTTSTIGTLLNTTNLIALGDSNTIGNLFTTGGNVGFGSASITPYNLYINGNSVISNLLGYDTTQVANDTLYLGTSGQGNFFVERLNTGHQIVFGYNTPKGNTEFSPLKVYNNSTDRETLLACNSAGVSSGSNSVYIGRGISNVSSFAYSYTTTRTIGNTLTMLTGGSTITDTRSGFSATTGRYTIPATGYYHFSFNIRADASGVSAVNYAYIRSGATTIGADLWLGNDRTASNRRFANYNSIISFNQGDEVYVCGSSNGSVTNSIAELSFSLHLFTLS